MVNIKKQIRREQKEAQRQKALSGTGTYLFENNTRGDFHLPRPTKDGLRMVKLGGQFFGDSYYFTYLKSGELRLIKEINESAQPEKLFVYKNFNRDQLKLPEANRDGQIYIAPGGEFVGDSRYFPLLKSGRLKLVKEVESHMQETKLLTEQPPVVTHAGQVEFVKNDDQYLTEDGLKKKEKTITEGDPMAGVKLLLD